jgi:hypothetical protein
VQQDAAEILDCLRNANYLRRRNLPDHFLAAFVYNLDDLHLGIVIYRELQITLV